MGEMGANLATSNDPIYVKTFNTLLGIQVSIYL